MLTGEVQLHDDVYGLRRFKGPRDLTSSDFTLTFLNKNLKKSCRIWNQPNSKT